MKNYFLLLLFCCTAILARAEESTSTLLEDLSTCGNRYGVYFTIEAYELSDVWTNRPPFKYVEDIKLESLSDFLKAKLEKYDIVVSSQNPRIFHIIDKRLLHLEQYPLNHVVDSLNFSGTARGLAIELSKQITGLSVQNGYPGVRLEIIPSAIYYDFGTPVKIADKNKPVREILTEAIPLKGYKPILWTAQIVKFPEEKPKIEINYCGTLSNTPVMCKLPPPNMRRQKIEP